MSMHTSTNVDALKLLCIGSNELPQNLTYTSYQILYCQAVFFIHLQEIKDTNHIINQEMENSYYLTKLNRKKNQI